MAEILQQAAINRHYRDKEGDTKLNYNDLKLAIKLKQMNCFTRPISSFHVQQVALEKNSIPLANLVLGPAHTIQDQQFMKTPIGTPEYSEMLQEKCKKANNMNHLPVGLSVRLDYPNF